MRGEAVSETKEDVFEAAIDLVKTWWPYPGNAIDQADDLIRRWKNAPYHKPLISYCYDQDGEPTQVEIS
jgi:hypothetical protein